MPRYRLFFFVGFLFVRFFGVLPACLVFPCWRSSIHAPAFFACLSCFLCFFVYIFLIILEREKKKREKRKNFLIFRKIERTKRIKNINSCNIYKKKKRNFFEGWRGFGSLKNFCVLSCMCYNLVFLKSAFL